jgi:3-hydroxy-9,10-secoandrosta-1,3,5(10)-triene-9,17-dione monooxygenase
MLYQDATPCRLSVVLPLARPSDLSSGREYDMTPQTYLDRVRALLPALRQRAVDTERLRRLPNETFKDFQEAGLFQALQPRRYGGYELDPATFYQAVMEMGTVCSSSAWVLGVVGVHNWQLGLFHPQAQEDVWRDDTTVLLSTSLAPTGKVQCVDGGYRLQGRWSFSSGCDFCQWVVLGGMIPAVQAGAPPVMCSFLVPQSDYTIDDNWYVMGLCGTGSKDIVIEEAFVPIHRTLSYPDMFYLRCPGTEVNPAPLFRLPFGSVFPYAIATPAVGAARGALEAFREQTKARVSARDKQPMAEDAFTQLAVAEATTEVDAVYDRVLGNFKEMMHLACQDQEIPLTSRARYRWDAAKAVASSVRAANSLLKASSGRVVFLSNPIQRAWRDIHAMQAHAGNNLERAAAAFGRSEFGLPPQDFRL